MLEEAFECTPKSFLESMFSLLEDLILHNGGLEGIQNNILLKICNGILKRLSLTKDTEFRGRIQLLISYTFPISEKSGVNVNGTYNISNVI